MKNAGVWFGVSLLAFSGGLFEQAWSYSYYSKIGPGPGLFPVWLSGMLFVVSLLYVVDTLRNGSISIREVLPRGEGAKNVLILMAALVAFIVGTPYLGYLLGSVALLSVLFALDYRWFSAIGLGVVVTAVVYYGFKVILSVPLPKGMLFS